MLTKGTYQNRARGVAILARLDFGGAPHRNRDDQEIVDALRNYDIVPVIWSRRDEVSQELAA